MQKRAAPQVRQHNNKLKCVKNAAQIRNHSVTQLQTLMVKQILSYLSIFCISSNIKSLNSCAMADIQR